MKDYSDYQQDSVSLVLRYCQEIESILGLRFGAKGRNIHEKLNFLQGFFPNELKQKIIRIMILGERALHDSRFQIHDAEHFSQNCDDILQQLNHLAEQFDTHTFKYNLFYLIKQLGSGLLFCWLVSLGFHLRAASLPSFDGYKVIFWSLLACSIMAVLLLGFFLKSRHFHQEKLDQILAKILVILAVLNPLVLSVVTIILFLVNIIRPHFLV